MAKQQIDLAAYADAIARAYDASNSAATPAELRDKFDVAADKLSERFNSLSGRWVEDTAAEFKAVQQGLDGALEALNKPLKDVAAATRALDSLKTLISLADSFLNVLL